MSGSEDVHRERSWRFCDCGCGRPMVGRGPTELFFDDTHKRRATSRLLKERFELIVQARKRLEESNWRDDDVAEMLGLFHGLASSARLAGSAKHGIPASPDLLDLAEKLQERGQRNCVFRGKWNADFGGSGTRISEEVEHRFREVEHRFRTKWNIGFRES